MPDCTSAVIRRELQRHAAAAGSGLYERQLHRADTALLAPAFELLSRTRSTIERAEIERLALAAAARAGVPRVRDVPSLRAFWTVHRSEYIEYEGLERLSAYFVETRFGRWIAHAVANRFGPSFRTGVPVLSDLRRWFPPMLVKVLAAEGVALWSSVVLGIWLASRRAIGTCATAVGARVAPSLLVRLWRRWPLLLALPPLMPPFVVASLVAGVFVGAHNPRLATSWSFGVLVATATSTLVGPLRSSLREAARSPHVRTAQALGMSARSVWLRAIVRPTALPLLAASCVQLPSLLVTALLIDNVLGVPGLGREAVLAMRDADVPWLMAFVCLMALLSIAMTIVADVQLALSDPRLRGPLVAGEHDDDV